MCNLKVEGGQRCPSSEPEYRRASRAAKRAQAKRPRKRKDVECRDCDAGIRWWQDEDGVPHRCAVCEACGGCGYIGKDAAGVAA